MLIWNGKEWTQFIGSKRVERAPGSLEGEDEEQYVNCVRTEPLDNVDRVSSKETAFLTVLHDFLDDPNASYVDGNAAVWRRALDQAYGAVL